MYYLWPLDFISFNSFKQLQFISLIIVVYLLFWFRKGLFITFVTWFFHEMKILFKPALSFTQKLFSITNLCSTVNSFVFIKTSLWRWQWKNPGLRLVLVFLIKASLFLTIFKPRQIYVQTVIVNIDEIVPKKADKGHAIWPSKL